MNKKRFLKALMIGLIIAVAGVFVAGNVMAQVITSQIMLQNGAAAGLNARGQVVDVDADGRGDVTTALVDNFEYWNNPRNMGWNVIEPPYPVWGAGLGYGQVNNVLDFEQGSRVFDVYRPMSVFLMNTQYDVFQCYKPCVFNDGNTIDGRFSAMSVEVRAPLAIEQFDSFQIIVNVKATPQHGDDSGSKVDATLVFRAIEGPQGYFGIMNPLADGEALEEDAVIMVALGRMFQDGTWHLVMEDLAELLGQYDRGADEDVDTGDEPILNSIEVILLRGNQYRLDNIMFCRPAVSISGNGAVHLFHVGPIYCQLYGQQGANPQGRWLIAEDGDLGMNVSYNEDGDMVFEDITDTTLPDDRGFSIIDGKADPNFTEAGMVLPGGPDDADLTWILTMGDTLGPVITDGFIERATITITSGLADIDADDMNSWPPYLIQEDGILIQNMVDPNYDPDTGNSKNMATPYLASLDNPMYALATALGNSGYEVFPQAIRIVPHLGQVFEDMIVTARVSDGIVTDKEVFPVSVVNYPVTNNPPIINDVDDQIFYVGMQNAYRIVAIDPDMQDMGALTYHATLNGLPNYQYGPWMNQIIGPCTGLITFVPQFEGALDCIVTVQDPRGMAAVCEITIFCVNQGGWFNHPPIVLGDLDSPQTIRAGEMFIANEMQFQDPDGDKMYWSCNVGSVGNNGVYTFQTQFPGYYMVQITAYDIRGGAATTEFVLHVRPWWSM